MDLKLNDVAELLNVSEATISAWLEDGKIPAYRIDEEYRFDRLEIEDWVMKQKLNETHGASPFSETEVKEKSERSPSSKGGGSQQFCLYRAIYHGMVIVDAEGDGKEDLIRRATEEIAPPLQLDPLVLSELLLDREALMPTALANGVGVPHTRDQIYDRYHDVVAVVFPKEPVEYGALDNIPVHSLFFLFANSNKRHLHLLAKIAHLAYSPEALELLQRKPSKSELLEFIRSWEKSIPVNRNECEEREVEEVEEAEAL
ncbi:MAG: PTS sugar transporter subunit IIA [Chlamydiia bacterium]|nr:PTS sugar transporter subunit IIA [Chlamydiia bacterium]